MVRVVDYERLERLRPPPHPLATIPFNLNTLSIVIILITALLLYKRYVNVTQSRQQFHT